MLNLNTHNIYTFNVVLIYVLTVKLAYQTVQY